MAARVADCQYEKATRLRNSLVVGNARGAIALLVLSAAAGRLTMLALQPSTGGDGLLWEVPLALTFLAALYGWSSLWSP